MFRSSEVGVTVVPQARQELLCTQRCNATLLTGPITFTKSSKSFYDHKVLHLVLGIDPQDAKPRLAFLKGISDIRHSTAVSQTIHATAHMYAIRSRTPPGAACTLMVPSERLALRYALDSAPFAGLLELVDDHGVLVHLADPSKFRLE